MNSTLKKRTMRFSRWTAEMAYSCTILCVDDEPSVLTMQKALLESAGFRVLAASGSGAITLFESEPVELVVIDWLMPGMNGITAAKMMKASKPEVPIIFLSAYCELPGETLGLAEWWVKKGEYEPERFLDLLRHTIAARAA